MIAKVMLAGSLLSLLMQSLQSKSRNSGECGVDTEELGMQEQPCHEIDGDDAPWILTLPSAPLVYKFTS